MLFTINYRIRRGAALLAAACLCCLSCVRVDYTIGSDLISESSKYTIIPDQQFPIDLTMRQTDSLSGFSNLRMTIGSIRDKDLGLSRRACAFTLVPLDTLDFGDKGTVPKFKSFHFSAAYDTVTVENLDQSVIFQSANVYALKEPIRVKSDYDCNADISSKVDWSKRISSSRPVLNGEDSLSFDFTEEFAKRFFSITDEEKKDIDKYLEHFPGVYIDVDDPVGIGGRFNHYEIQLSFDPDYHLLNGNYASLYYRATFNGVEKDTAAFFYYSPTDFFPADSLVSKGIGSLPQYCFNQSSFDTTSPGYTSGSKETMYAEGGGGLKPVIRAAELREKAMKIIKDSLIARGRSLADTAKVIITKATVELPFIAPDSEYVGMFKYPQIISPCVRTHVTDTTGGASTKLVQYNNISDASNSSENQGDINRSLLTYSPDITYHLQEILSIDPKSSKTTAQKFKNGEFDIWMMNMAYESITTTTATSDEMSDYYSYLAYQSYYSSIYGGYSGGYGYGDPYSNYYSYMLASMYASGSTTNTTTELRLDKDRFYKIALCGPQYSETSRRPRLWFSFMFPNK